MNTQLLGWRSNAATLLGVAVLAMGMFGGNTASAFTTNLVASQDSFLDYQLSSPSVANANKNGIGYLDLFANDYTSPTEMRRAIMSFDLSFLAGATITSATLKLGVPTYEGTGGPFDPSAPNGVNRLLKDFVENQVTWNSNSLGSAWATPGALGATDSTNIATGVNNGGLSPNVEWALGGLNVSQVTSNWFVAPDTTQLGFLVYYLPLNTLSRSTYGTRESLDGPGPGPVLEISYIPEPTVVGLIGLGGLLAGFARFRRRV